MRNYFMWTVKNGGVRVTNGMVNNSGDKHSPRQATKLTHATIHKKTQKNMLKVIYSLDLYFYVWCGGTSFPAVLLWAHTHIGR